MIRVIFTRSLFDELDELPKSAKSVPVNYKITKVNGILLKTLIYQYLPKRNLRRLHTIIHNNLEYDN